ncbi:hypothetical protein T265_15090 [Opisthorchis viverrini]|uniref:Cys-rich domain protein n=1 Tax=Opisthorchis viverrini TaxID=6198 RepID=A0A074Z373_OPIVI|nr:hypothetical protein T265_15090 [Opisthorchis viverrini]KER21458.1 hypothetical protein T265_15090 [Opisthorchis viverrini]
MSQPVTQQPEPVQQREWTTNMFGCCEDVPRCFLVACCAPCYLCHMYKYDHEACFLPIFGAGPILLRVKHRFKHNIRGTLLKDLCASTFCGPCVMCQLKADMDQMKKEGR